MLACFKKKVYLNISIIQSCFSSINNNQAIDYHKAVLASRIIRHIDKDL